MRVSVFCSLERGSLNMWRVISNTTIHTITPAVAVAMRTGDWDCMPLIVWAATFPECTRPTADSGVFMCAVTRQLAPSGQGRVAVRLLCETWNRFGPSPSQALRQYSLLFLIRGSYCSPAQNLCGHFSWSHACYFFLKVAACGGLHMIPVWSCRREMHLLCGDVKH